MRINHHHILSPLGKRFLLFVFLFFWMQEITDFEIYIKFYGIFLSLSVQSKNLRFFLHVSGKIRISNFYQFLQNHRDKIHTFGVDDDAFINGILIHSKCSFCGAQVHAIK